MTLVLPGEVAERILNENEVRKAGRFYKRLRELDPAFKDCMFATSDWPEINVRTGFHYIVRHNANGSWSFLELRHPETGGPLDPVEHEELVISALKRNDAARGTLTQEWRKDRDAQQKAREREADRQREEREGKLKERVDYAFRVQHPITRKWN